MSSRVSRRLAFWRKVFCLLGAHRLNSDWSVGSGGTTHYTECIHCHKTVSEFDNWVITLDYLRGLLRPSQKYLTNPFWKWLTPSWTKLYLLEHDDSVVGYYEPLDLATHQGFDNFVYQLSRSHYVEVTRRKWFYTSYEDIDALQVLLLLATAENK